MIENKTNTNTKKNIHKAHERAFKSAMQDLRVAQGFFHHYLPVTVCKCIDLSTLQLHRETFIDAELKELVSDMLYSAEFKHKGNYKERAFLYLCVEHQRKAEILMPWRMVKYTVRVIDQYLLERGGTTLPLVVPIVVYNGDDAYPYSVSVFDLFGANKELAKSVVFDKFQLVDLTQIPDEAIRQHQWSGLMETLLKHIDARNIMVYLEGISELVERLVGLRADEYILSMLKYVIEKSEIADRQSFYDWTQAHLGAVAI